MSYRYPHPYDYYYGSYIPSYGISTAPQNVKKVFLCSKNRQNNIEKEIERMEGLPYFVRIELKATGKEMVANLPISTDWFRKLERDEVKDVNVWLKKELKKYDPDSKAYQRLLETLENLDEVATTKFNFEVTKRGKKSRAEAVRAKERKTRQRRRKYESESEEETDSEDYSESD